MYRVRTVRTVYTHSLLFEAACRALAQAKDSGAVYDYMHALVSAAFAFEAYLNFVGESLLPFWSAIQRARVGDKLTVICHTIDVIPDFGTRPYQSLKELWQLRNFLAHGRVQTATDEWSQPEETVSDLVYPKVDWETRCSARQATKILEDIEAIMTELHAKAGLTAGAPGMLSTHGASISPEKNGA